VGPVIKDVQTAVVEANYDWTYVKVIDDRHVGYGECFFAPGLTAVVRELKPLVVGRDPFDIRRILHNLRTAGFMASPHGGVLHHVMAAIEAALWDIVGNRLGVPVYKLWGGLYRNRLRLYADCHAGEGLASLNSINAPRVPWWMGEDSEVVPLEVHPRYHGGRSNEAAQVDIGAYSKRASEAVEAGYTAVKFDLDIPNPYSRDDYNRMLSPKEVELLVEVVSAVRDAIGPDVDVAVDCHWNFSAESAIAAGKALAAQKLMWLEDPVPPGSDEAFRRVVRESATPVATGEHHYLATQFAHLLEAGLLIVAPDLQKTGLIEARRIAELADLYTASVAPHNISSALGTLQAAHLSATLPNFTVLEHHGLDVSFWEDIVSGRDATVIQDGHIELEDKPGFGASLNEEIAYAHRKRAEPFFDAAPG
jgi:L-alanine-DL-glutamate epimerase-like enolase superfamily enzyme